MRTFFTIAALLSLAGCTGTETGNPLRAKLSYDAHSSDPERVAVQVSEGGDVVEQAWLVLAPVRFVEQAGCTDDDGTDADALGAADHAASGHTEQLVELPRPDEFCRLDVPLLIAGATALPAGAPPELAGSSILLVGHTAGGAAFRISTSMTPVIHVDAVAGTFPMDEGDEDAVLLGFDVAGFLRDVDLTTAVPEGDGSIIVDATHNTALHAAFEAALGVAMELYRDVNENGARDGAEDALLARGT